MSSWCSNCIDRSRTSRLVTGAALLAALIAMAAFVPRGAEAAEHLVASDGGAWNPSSLGVAPGDTVTWSLNEAGHDIRLCAGADATCNPGDGNYITGIHPCEGLDCELEPVPEYPLTMTHTFESPGAYAYYCAIHPVFAGALTVLGPAPPQATARIAKVNRNRAKGAARVRVAVSAAGRVELLGSKKVKRASSRTGNAGNVVLTVKAKGKARKQLKRKGRTKVALRISYAPAAGKAVNLRRTVTLRRR